MPALMLAPAFIVTAAVAIASLLGTASTFEYTVPAPVAFEVKRAVAVPVLCMVVCALEIVPSVAPKVIGKPIRANKLSGEMVLEAELDVKPAVTFLVPPLHMAAGSNDVRSVKKGITESVPLLPPAARNG